MAANDVTLINNLDVLKDNYTIKGSTSVLRKWFSRFEKLLHETDCYFIKKPTLGENMAPYKYVDNQNKIGFNYDTTVARCNDFSGHIYGFQFTDFEPIIDGEIDEDSTIDVIGAIVRVFEIKQLTTKKGKSTRKLNIQLQDLRNKKIYLTLWDSFVDEVFDYLSNKEQNGPVILILLILQFGTLKYFGGLSYVNTATNVSRLFLNSDIDEVNSFKKSFLENRAGSTSSGDSSLLSSMFLSVHDEFVIQTEFNNIAEVNEIDTPKSVVIVGTIKLIPQDIPWFYDACKECNKKVIRHFTPADVRNTEGGYGSDFTFQCQTKRCENKVITAFPRFKIPLRVQDSSGIVSLTLFDREAKKIINKSAQEVMDNYLYGGDTGLIPHDFKEFLEKKWAFKIDITSYNLEKNYKFFTISKICDDESVILELEKKANIVENSDSVNVTSIDITSQETVSYKDRTEQTGDNVTPFSINEKSTARMDVVDLESLPSGSNNKSELKRKLDDTYNVEDVGSLSAMKICSNSNAVAQRDGKQILLTPKIEK